MSDTPRTDSDDRPYPSPECVQLIQFEGSTCAVMSPDDYEALYRYAQQLERELSEARRDLVSCTCQLGEMAEKLTAHKEALGRCYNALHGVRNFSWHAGDVEEALAAIAKCKEGHAK